jgi:hypothetical protein
LDGLFALSVHVTAGAQRGSVILARLWLRPGLGPGSGLPRRLPWIVEGRTTLSVSAPDSTAAATLSATHGPPLDVAGFWDPGDTSIALLRTGVEEESRPGAERGVALRVRRSGAGGFSGTWTTAFWSPAIPSGYFCARRLRGGDEEGREQ